MATKVNLRNEIYIYKNLAAKMMSHKTVNVRISSEIVKISIEIISKRQTSSFQVAALIMNI